MQGRPIKETQMLSREVADIYMCVPYIRVALLGYVWFISDSYFQLSSAVCAHSSSSGSGWLEFDVRSRENSAMKIMCVIT